VTLPLLDSTGGHYRPSVGDLVGIAPRSARPQFHRTPRGEEHHDRDSVDDVRVRTQLRLFNGMRAPRLHAALARVRSRRPEKVT